MHSPKRTLFCVFLIEAGASGSISHFSTAVAVFGANRYLVELLLGCELWDRKIRLSDASYVCCTINRFFLNKVMFYFLGINFCIASRPQLGYCTICLSSIRYNKFLIVGNITAPFIF